MSDASLGILFLALAAVSTSVFSLIMKYSQERGYSVLAVGAVNYIAAAVAAALRVPWRETEPVTTGMWLLAAGSGVGFVRGETPSRSPSPRLLHGSA